MRNGSFRFLREFRTDGEPVLAVGDTIDLVGVTVLSATISGSFLVIQTTNNVTLTYGLSGDLTGYGFAVGGEVRYQSAVADLPADQDFTGSKIDLGGFNYLLTFNVRF